MSMPPSACLVLALAAAALPLGGCSSFDRAFGVEKVVPDEFAVVSRAPLAIPPDYTLRPPRPGAAPAMEVSSTDKVKAAIFRAAGDQQAALPDADKRSPGENELLRAAGAANAAPDIRDTIAKEARSGEVDQGFVDKLLFWREPDYKLGPTDAVIDPASEQRRLATIQPAAGGAAAPSVLTRAPVIERTKAPTMLATF